MKFQDFVGISGISFKPLSFLKNDSIAPIDVGPIKSINGVHLLFVVCFPEPFSFDGVSNIVHHSLGHIVLF